MNRTCLGLLFAVCSIGHLSAQMGTMNAPTFTKDVAPIEWATLELGGPPARPSLRESLETFHPDPVGMVRVRISHASFEGGDLRRLLGYRGRAAEGTRIEAIGHVAGVAPERVSGGKAPSHHVLIGRTFYHASRNHFLHSASGLPERF